MDLIIEPNYHADTTSKCYSNAEVKIFSLFKNRFAQIPNVFPSDGSDLVIQICQSTRAPSECKGNPPLEKEKAFSIARRFFNATFSK